MPRKKRQLKADLRKAGFYEVNDRGKGCHSVWKQPLAPDITVVLSGRDGADADHCEEKHVRDAIAEVRWLSWPRSGRRCMAHEVDRSPIRPEEFAEARRYALVIEWSEEDQKYLVTAPDLPGMITSGRTRAEAAEMGEEATAVWISANRHVGQPIPEPRFTALPDYLREPLEPATVLQSA